MKKWTFLILLTVLWTLGGCQVYNSSSGDVVKFSDGATAIFQNKCSQCHSYGSQTTDQLVSAGLIVKGDPTSSLIYQRIRGSNVGGAENMPPSGTSTGDVTTEELDIIKTWIEGL
ncbi:MAG: hypothetical protein ACOYOK_08675 [Pseudobdellovibrionaceae bacterium]